ncbi:Nicotinamide-nucleotide amidohydrolase PncC [Gimesia alba]|uniref:Nicotinamide-nucleotide amidohydrolase PncC n=1 Tax=Gimesia alba TaxID=2527973 RepID=A0A517R967_9PLAN|nr:nicotinamide-nucleotide amidohydrolase family protein [Gimesia alba]QDT40408.1 Nicotinamide-nucleotide amidohydrolase PncC [Gimesia alba]
MVPEFLIQVATQVKEALTLRGQRLVIAESCTGGLVATSFTSLPGISEYFCGSAVVYRWDTKMKWLGVKPETLEKYTDVSVETAREMALGVLKQTPEASLAASITGHLGPDAPQQQDGMICIAVAVRTASGLDSSPELFAVETFQCDRLMEEVPLDFQPSVDFTLRQYRQLTAARQMLKLILAALES